MNKVYFVVFLKKSSNYFNGLPVSIMEGLLLLVVILDISVSVHLISNFRRIYTDY